MTARGGGMPKALAIAASAVTVVSAYVVIGAASSSAVALSPARVGTAPELAAGASWLGPLTASTPLKVDVVLRPRAPAALARFATEVSTPGTALYRHYLARGQFAGIFGPTRTAIAAVESDLTAHGLFYGRIAGDHLSIPVHASASALERAFSLRVDRVRLPSGRTAYANRTAPRFSGAASRAVETVIGLDNLTLPHHESLVRTRANGPAKASPHVLTGGPQPCEMAMRAGLYDEAFTADQLASAYRFSSLYGAGDEGTGVSVALYELEPNLTSDIATYQACYGTSTSVTYTEVDSGAGTGAGEGEAALDIEDVIGLAPKASIDVYQGPNTNAGAYDTYNTIISGDTSQVISTSWGQCESEEGSRAAQAENTLFEEAAADGQSIFAASGDDGSEDCGGKHLAVDDPASQPYVTGVGGTTITALGPPPTEVVWNDASKGTGAGGGGISTLWKMPSYQTGALSDLNVINSESSGTPCGAAVGSYCREVPDVTADADPYSGYVYYHDGNWLGIGGTSAAAPLWAAFAALTDSSSSCNGTAIGFANPVLYEAAASSYSSDFQDVTSGENDYTGSNGGLYKAGAGYDMASGLGSPDGANLPAALCSDRSSANTVTVTNPGTQTTTVGASVSLQVVAADSSPSATLTYTATGLPTGLSISAASGVISGSPSRAASSTVTVTATDDTSSFGLATFTWTVTSSCPAKQSLGNPGFETGVPSPWTSSAGVVVSTAETGGVEVARSGSWFAWLDGYGVPHTDWLMQKVSIPSDCTSYVFSYYQHIDTFEDTATKVADTLEVQVLSSTRKVLKNLATYSNLNAAKGYHLVTFDLAAYAGRAVYIKFIGVERDTYDGTTDFTIDDTALRVS